jgi:hypothetical protein
MLAGVMSLVLLAIAILLPWLVVPRDAEAAVLSRLERVLLAVEIAARAGVVDPWRGVGRAEAAHFRELGHVLAAARRAGHPVAGSIAALRREVTRGLARARQRAQLLMLVRGRLSLAVGVAATARLGLEVWASGRAHGVVDVACLTAAAAATGLTTRLFFRSLPESWLWTGRLSEAAAAWLRSHLSGAPGPVAGHEIATLCRRELRQGVALGAEKRRALVTSARLRAAAERARRRACLEALPVIEIAGFGLIAGLVLAAPALAALGWTERPAHVKDGSTTEDTP